MSKQQREATLSNDKESAEVEIGLEVKEKIASMIGKGLEQAVVVLGEASESDDDEIVTDHSSPSTNIVVKAEASGKQQAKETKKTLVYNSLLHRKLRERNVAMRDHIVQEAKQPYGAATKDLNSMTQLLVKSQSLVQEVSTILRQVTNDVFQLEDKLDIAIDCSRLVPDIDIRIPSKTPAY